MSLKSKHSSLLHFGLCQEGLMGDTLDIIVSTTGEVEDVAKKVYSAIKMIDFDSYLSVEDVMSMLDFVRILHISSIESVFGHVTYPETRTHEEFFSNLENELISALTLIKQEDDAKIEKENKAIQQQHELQELARLKAKYEL